MSNFSSSLPAYGTFDDPKGRRRSLRRRRPAPYDPRRPESIFNVSPETERRFEGEYSDFRGGPTREKVRHMLERYREPVLNEQEQNILAEGTYAVRFLSDGMGRDERDDRVRRLLQETLRFRRAVQMFPAPLPAEVRALILDMLLNPIAHPLSLGGTRLEGPNAGYDPPVPGPLFGGALAAPRPYPYFEHAGEDPGFTGEELFNPKLRGYIGPPRPDKTP